MVTIENDSSGNGDMRAFVGERCIAVAWARLPCQDVRRPAYSVFNVWQGGEGVPALSRMAACTVLRRMAASYIDWAESLASLRRPESLADFYFDESSS